MTAACLCPFYYRIWDKLSGTTADRPQLKECRRYLRKGDTLVITKFDRLARSTFHLCQIRDELIEKGVELLVLDQSIDTTSITGKLMFNMLGAIAEFEMRSERSDGAMESKQPRLGEQNLAARLNSPLIKLVRCTRNASRASRSTP
ncbi:recombinase family protein [Microbulbifer hydrolyticus]|uniref:Recombinase family protein n=1 Tax=Microbulbifer hydrolyticus TaxID=48074 RepID=A0ABX6IXU9_9GAMM|nr:recombinase family protein [Microbulbifer hydrolyticus]